ncbi:MAG TPA: hypothetical protein VKV26_04570 [Dehalococcoidia bacterium]|nr:hypothetical protein [Dehalococcoidia bacterium]
MPSADYEGTARQPYLPRTRTSRFNVIARFPDPASAARAVERIRAGGIAASDVSVLGGAGDEVEPGSGLMRADAAVVRSVWTRAWLWGLAGAVIGAVIGIILILIPGFRHAVRAQPDWPAFIAAILIGGIVGAIGGALAGMVGGLDRSEAHVDTYADEVACGPELVGYTPPTSRRRVSPPPHGARRARPRSTPSRPPQRSRPALRRNRRPGPPEPAPRRRAALKRSRGRS